MAHKLIYFSLTSVFGDFLIDGENCKIPNLSPFSANAMRVFKRVKYKKCDDRKPLTSVQRDEDGNSRLIINYAEKKIFLYWFMNEMRVSVVRDTMQINRKISIVTKNNCFAKKKEKKECPHAGSSAWFFHSIFSSSLSVLLPTNSSNWR